MHMAADSACAALLAGRSTIMPLKMLVIFFFAMSSPAACVIRQLPEDTIKTATALFAERGLRDIEKAAADEMAKQIKLLQGPLPFAQKELQNVIDSSLTQTLHARNAEEESQAAKVAWMNKAIEDARAKVLPEAVETASEFARSRALTDTAKALEPYFDTAVQVENRAEDERRDASLTIQAAEATSNKMQELAHEAHDLANYLNQVHAGGHAQAANERNNLAEAQANQSLRIAREAGKLVHDSAGLAYAALRRSKTAENQAAEALAIARRNTLRLQKLKTEAQNTFERVKAMAGR